MSHFAQIFLNLAHNNPEISQILCAALFNHLENTFVHGSAQRQYILCGGVISSLSEVIEKSSDTFREVLHAAPLWGLMPAHRAS